MTVHDPWNVQREESKDKEEEEKRILYLDEAEKACNKKQSEIKVKMKGAEQNLKKFFVEIKKILDK